MSEPIILIRMTAEARKQIFNVFDKHRDIIEYRNKGTIKTMLDIIKKETNLIISVAQYNRLLSLYRTENKMTIKCIVKPKKDSTYRAYTRYEKVIVPEPESS